MNVQRTYSLAEDTVFPVSHFRDHGLSIENEAWLGYDIKIWILSTLRKGFAECPTYMSYTIWKLSPSEGVFLWEKCKRCRETS
jgi:hypothetical protein